MNKRRQEKLTWDRVDKSNNDGGDGAPSYDRSRTKPTKP
ncbi:unnamed protein product [Spirodela intermedia]|uniref:Uncharacterized protein n=1 Tax=Spirodela intermedia TaxID=51605 RepID=A0A7I8IFF0_SPIIN|nr:unnamed protein product [Spirodela intermedia]CAA6656548.1 unnamed protein product [Spirodela intermedia]